MWAIDRSLAMFIAGAAMLAVSSGAKTASAQGILPPPAALRMEVTKTGSGNGIVISEPAGITCGTTCSAFFTNSFNSYVELTAIPDAGSVFAGWPGCEVTPTGRCRILVFSSTAYVIQVAARFDLQTQSGPPQYVFENPTPGSFQSGIGVISGWACDGEGLAVRLNGEVSAMPHGSERPDTIHVCNGKTNNGFGMLFNFNRLGPGVHTIELLRKGASLGGPRQFTVTVPLEEFARGLAREVTIPDFPSQGRTTTLVWQEALQNFAIKSVRP